MNQMISHLDANSFGLSSDVLPSSVHVAHIQWCHISHAILVQINHSRPIRKQSHFKTLSEMFVPLFLPMAIQDSLQWIKVPQRNIENTQKVQVKQQHHKNFTVVFSTHSKCCPPSKVKWKRKTFAPYMKENKTEWPTRLLLEGHSM